jgi:hypothetical protein
MTRANDSILLIGLHAGGLTFSSFTFSDFFSVGDIQVLEITQLSSCAKQEMIRQELKQAWLVDISHLVQFDTLRIIHVQVLFLSNSEHVFILEEMNISNELFRLKFSD